MLDDVASEEDDDEGRGANAAGETGKVPLVVDCFWVQLFYHRLPHDVGKLDGEPVREDHDRQVSEVLGARQKLERLAETHLRLLRLLLGGCRRRGYRRRLALNQVHVMVVQRHHGDSTRAHCTSDPMHRARHVGALRRRVETHVLPRQDWRQRRHLPEERVEAHRLGDGHNSVGKLPEQHADAHGRIKFGHHVEKGECPVLI
mmetsp:Transcript_98944/g.283024  ORF Transcript_98944/g.283024 Transcript_98944/m.283024 type:complete len:202 (+) Transcript_98944:466-1071(+)